MRTMNLERLTDYERELLKQQKAPGTVEKYLRDINYFYDWLGEDKTVNKSRVAAYREHLKERYAISTANSMMVALNRYFSYLGWDACRVKTVTLQKPLLLNKEKELTWSEYHELIDMARAKGKEQLALIIETIGSCGINISELELITVEAVRFGSVTVSGKGSHWEVSLDEDLKKKLQSYCKKKGITEGSIFISHRENPLNRSYIWREMKTLGEQTGIRIEKINPRTLRNFFLHTYYLSDIHEHGENSVMEKYIIEQTLKRENEREQTQMCKSLQELERRSMEAGRKEGEKRLLKRQVKKKLAKGKNAETIADELEEEVSIIQPLIDEILAEKQDE